MTDSKWEVAMAPYFWGIGLDGTVASENVQTSFELDFADIWEELDFAALTVLEIQYDKVSLTTNLTYLEVSPESHRAVGSVLPGAPPGDFDVEVGVQTVLFEAMPGYEVASVSLGDQSRVAFDLRGGIRYWWMKTELDVRLDPSSPLGPFRRELESTDDWVDVLVGARMRVQLTRKLGLVVAGDVGGFELGRSSDFTWSVNALLMYALGEHWHLAGGWRAIDYERGAADVRTEGITLGGVYRF
jgi:hypothetical protein